MSRTDLPTAALRRVFHLPPSPELPPGFTVHLPSRGGTTFAAEVPGPTPDAPTLFLLHGLVCTGYLNWFPAIDALKQHYRLILMDMRGHGRGIPVGGRFFRLKDCADDAVALADELGIDTFIPVGYSLGGPVAQLIWHRHPERVEGMVLCATARNFRGRPQERLFFLLLPGVVMALSMRRPATEATEAFASKLAELPSGASLEDLGLPRWAIGEVRRTSPWTIIRAINAIGQFSSHRWIGDVDVPTAVVVTANDNFIPTSRQFRLAAAIPDATMHPFPGNHAACVLESHKFVPALLEGCASVTERIASASR